MDGAFKTPGLRNVELTAPYFHNGGDLSLMHTVDFYNRGGNFPELNQGNLDPNIVRLGLTPEEKQALVALMVAMTDERSQIPEGAVRPSAAGGAESRHSARSRKEWKRHSTEHVSAKYELIGSLLPSSNSAPE